MVFTIFLLFVLRQRSSLSYPPRCACHIGPHQELIQMLHGPACLKHRDLDLDL
eukprot:m.28044 g.28044  ORF g.28044 m.28044 type:complete len:53 (-) comp10368_c0_seq1:53-211(-)